MRDQRGTTLVELTIGMGLLLFILSSVYSFQYLVTRQNGTATALFQSRDSVETAMKRVSNDVREAEKTSETTPAVALANRNELTMYVNADSDPELERVHYSLSGQNLIRGVSQPSGTQGAFGVEVSTTIATSLVNTTGTPLFRYFQSSTTETTALPLSAIDRASVRLVRLNPKTTNRYGSVALETDVYMRNTKQL